MDKFKGIIYSHTRLIHGLPLMASQREITSSAISRLRALLIYATQAIMPLHAIPQLFVAPVVLSLVHTRMLLVNMWRWPPQPRCQTSGQL